VAIRTVKKKPKMMSSAFAKLRRETGQAQELRKPLYKRLESHFNARVFSFFTSYDPGYQIEDTDAEMLESILAAEYDGNKLMLVLSSPGGQALAAERIVNVCRAYSGNRFEVIVPHMAKSAATMICFGANKIHMSKTAELGPVDAQVVFKDDLGTARQISAQEYITSYEDLIKASTGGKAPRIEPYLQQLGRYDARYIKQLASAGSLSRDISVSLLKTGMMSGTSEKQIEKSIQIFLAQERTRSHGRMINYEGAKKCGLNIEMIPLQSDVWNDLWELYVSADYVVSNMSAKLIESRDTAVHAPRYGNNGS
jgi:hypothetical protein